jgi:hypothetical protein
MLYDRQKEFGAAILDSRKPVPLGLVGPDGQPSVKRFAVYRNNVVVGLIDALKEAYPAIVKIVGDEFFKAMAAAYVVTSPPPSPIMLDYGVGFSEFVEAFEPAKSLPYLTDVARIERAWTESYHARESRPFDIADLTALSPEQFGSLTFVVHPSLRIIRSKLPALSIWKMNTEGGTPEAIDVDSGGQDTMIVRPDAEVEVRLMPPGGAVFLQQLLLGKTVTEALREAVADCETFDLTGNLSGLFEAGVFVGWKLADN